MIVTRDASLFENPVDPEFLTGIRFASNFRTSSFCVTTALKMDGHGLLQHHSRTVSQRFFAYF